ncbi:hypothetical protein HAX54_032920 [Datura stramonium]|uniref:Pentatricopeptide repeat-containing protein n=1 Tax=Datura stramonium TaxID=4076 RepID=A0ABS8SD39_DATST|nr:hypothetical protein [Datura stramonium]
MPGSLNSVVSVATGLGHVEMAERVFGEMCDRGVCPDSVSFESMVVAYCRIGRVVEADRWLSAMLERGFLVDNATCTLIMSVLCEKGSVNRALWIFNKLIELGLAPNVINYTCLINGLCKKNKSWSLMPPYTALIDGYCKVGNFDVAYKFLRVMDEKGLAPGIFTYNAVIDGLCKKGRVQEAYKMLKKGLKPTKETCTSMICGYCRDKNVAMAKKYFQRMGEYGCVPDSLTYGALISGLCKESKLDEARELYNSMRDKGIPPCEVTRLTVAYEYCKNNEPTIAMDLLDSLDKKLWIRTVSTLVRKLCSEKNVDIAALFFHKLLDRQQSVDRVTLAAFMSACYESNNYDLVSSMNERLTKDFGKTSVLVISLVLLSESYDLYKFATCQDSWPISKTFSLLRGPYNRKTSDLLNNKLVKAIWRGVQQCLK